MAQWCALLDIKYFHLPVDFVFYYSTIYFDLHLIFFANIVGENRKKNKNSTREGKVAWRGKIRELLSISMEPCHRINFE